ncbi:MAG: Holliday junction branch migration protein RuvA [Nitriliruptoraceae bacterium]
MIAQLTGTLAARYGDAVLLDVNGVGYEVTIPAGTVLPAIGESLQLSTVLHVREDAHTLFGFRDRASRDLFTMLISASGVGPKLAIVMLSTLRADALVNALRSRDTDVLVTVPGIGKKVAERLVLELHDKASSLNTFASFDPASPADHGARQLMNDVHEALLALGYSTGEADTAVAAVNTETTTDASELLRHALTHLTVSAKRA